MNKFHADLPAVRQVSLIYSCPDSYLDRRLMSEIICDSNLRDPREKYVFTFKAKYLLQFID